MKIALLGYGKMGKVIEEIALKRGHSVVFKTNEASIEKDVSKADVAIDFSTPETVVDNIKKCFAVNVPVVVGTTGWYERFSEVCRLCELGGHSLFHASNFSIGVNILFEVNKTLARLMNTQTDYEIKMTETHHTQKLDSPSGTAITLADGIIENMDRKSSWSEKKLGEESILIQAKRERDVPGTHIVNYENEIDKIVISHEAKGRIGFASGALLAAEWLQEKHGVYTMKDLLKL